MTSLVGSGKEAPKQAPSLEVGAKVTCRVQEVLDQGCKVELDGGVFGFIPNHHLTNVPVKNLQTMFPVGKKLKCKVKCGKSMRLGCITFWATQASCRMSCSRLQCVLFSIVIICT